MSPQVGRPPLNASAMTPNTPRVHKKNCIRQKSKTALIEGKRRDAANKRWRMHVLPPEDVDEDDSTESGENVDAAEEPDDDAEELGDVEEESGAEDDSNVDDRSATYTSYIGEDSQKSKK